MYVYLSYDFFKENPSFPDSVNRLLFVIMTNFFLPVGSGFYAAFIW